MSVATEETPKPVSITLTGNEQIRQFKGRRVQIVMRSGKEFEGIVGEVTGNNVELKGLTGRDFYDALIRIEDVSAVVYQARDK